ncbi:Crp/Fnr family transcriptional regulator [Arthrospiribacter ruber]|uniref:Crp/Fnr family transcriptional regulator n=1 Tax=Arthrospiribacter ruber TaxID=2487934 RepID=A0A951IVF6_9BACT|nr:Crp/Fnr family transcriptional regulator [Arthrospiribacter ruber]MBW3466606.1 Crp/Fnr family transcriptional regulator [Arthrospiribacter ruber]
MTLYKRRLQLKHYFEVHKLPLDTLCRQAMQLGIAMDFNKEEEIRFPDNNETVFFINKGIAAAISDQGSDSWSRLAGENTLITMLSHTDKGLFQKLEWYSLTKLKVLAIPYLAFKESQKKFMLHWEEFCIHLHKMEVMNMNHMAIINSLKSKEKIQYLEENFTDLVLQANYGILAKFIGLKRESFSRLISQKNQMPSIYN